MSPGEFFNKAIVQFVQRVKEIIMKILMKG